MQFKILSKEKRARVGEMETPSGVVKTPVFMPVGTHGAVKGVSPHELANIGSQIILANTYHLYLRPGESIIQGLGGLHKFMGWPRTILTDSGGFQVFSLGERGMAGDPRKALRKVSEEGIIFQSHLDGSKHLFTPEKSIAIQQALGADIMMAFDQPVYGMSSYSKAKEAMERTQRWLVQSRTQWLKGDSLQQSLFGIVQGGIYPDLHQFSAEYTASLDLPGNAIGGLSVGEGKKEMWEAVTSINTILPEAKPRYFMGLGEPLDLLEAVERGVDMFDCVSPSRLARHGVIWQVVADDSILKMFWQMDGERLLNGLKGRKIKIERWNLHNARFKDDSRIFIEKERQFGNELGSFSFGALHHFVQEGEMLGYRILTIHNIELLNTLVELARQTIFLSKFATFKDSFVF
jgi:queuine tRNA-ribosyltransferase